MKIIIQLVEIFIIFLPAKRLELVTCIIKIIALLKKFKNIILFQQFPCESKSRITLTDFQPHHLSSSSIFFSTYICIILHMYFSITYILLTYS